MARAYFEMTALMRLREVPQRLVLAQRQGTACMFAEQREMPDFARADRIVAPVTDIPVGATLQRHCQVSPIEPLEPLQP